VLDYKNQLATTNATKQPQW